MRQASIDAKNGPPAGIQDSHFVHGCASTSGSSESRSQGVLDMRRVVFESRPFATMRDCSTLVGVIGVLLRLS